MRMKSWLLMLEITSSTPLVYKGTKLKQPCKSLHAIALIEISHLISGVSWNVFG